MSSDNPSGEKPTRAAAPLMLSPAPDEPPRSAAVSGREIGLILALGIAFLMLCGLFALSRYRQAAAVLAPVAQVTFAPQQWSTATPQSEEDARAQAVAFWKPAIEPASVADGKLRSARSAFLSGDKATATRDLNDAQRAADDAYDAALANPPSGEEWSTVQSDLADGILIQRDALAQAKAGVQSGSAAAFGQADDAALNARKAIAMATGDARAWYVSHGGNPADIDGIDAGATHAGVLQQTQR